MTMVVAAWQRSAFALVTVWTFTVQSFTQQSKTGYDYVDPLIGTVNGGHVFPGATLPFGMAKAGADVYSNERHGGFASDDTPVYGFSHMHDSGTGGSPSLGNFPIFPQAGCPNDNPEKCGYSKWERQARYINTSVVAKPGYFALMLASQIHAEMTVSNHTALYRFTFPEAPSAEDSTLAPHIYLELGDLPNTILKSNITVYENGRMTGSGVFLPSFGSSNYTSYFCADFHGAKLKNSSVYPVGPPGIEVSPSGGWVQFHPPPNRQLIARVGMSFINEEKACMNAEKEIPEYNFDQTYHVAEKVWRDKLSVISVDGEGVSDVLLKSFWSGVYRSMISPQDYTGENPKWDIGEPYYDSFYCIWDSFRSIHPFITLVDPHSQTLMVRSLLDIYKYEGKLPDCRMSHCKGFTQGGSNADIVIVDAYLKNLTAGIDWTLAYEALISDAEIEPPNWDIEGRGGLDFWKSIGYIPTANGDTLGMGNGTGTETRSISRTVEYAYDDFCIALIARELGHQDDYEKYLKRSGNWKSMFKADQRSEINGVDSGFVGFLQPRYSNGSWGYQDPIFCSPLQEFTGCYLNPSGRETYEGPIWLYTFFAPGDMSTLISTLGGVSSFIKRLDFFHDSGLLYMGDEQAFLNVFLYHYAGRPGLSSKRARSYIPAQFNDTLGGIPGNDDSGAMGSFVALTMMGIFPNAGQDVYFIIPPFFKEVSLWNAISGKTATIRNLNFDGGGEGKNIYIQSAKLDGKEYTKNWLQHRFFLEGGTLELTLGSEESEWGTRAEDLPPSLGPFGRDVGGGGGGAR
ncbi:glycoside hydrolase family 92 protein [Sporormia fimetaria CBS 119925]|uniref:Glycoside hydrolase family 92 protein n=1 Tax=Sporormia fimetaria CBS 119925 TaxID=1340428 RepID=A0A6A6V0A0_9PLEO|nr:glycoside hydrolase family 92 protein [Sporormia fimetaria CBS 119925]